MLQQLRLVGLLLSILACAAVVRAATLETLNDDNYRELLGQFRSTWFVYIKPAGQDDTILHRDFLTIAERDEDATHRYAAVELEGRDTKVLLTSWLVFRAPYLVVSENGGTDTYFYSAYDLATQPDHVNAVLTRREASEPAWRQSKKRWTGRYAPGSLLNGQLPHLGQAVKTYYATVGQLPAWAMLLISFGLSRVISRSLDKDRRRAASSAHLHTE